MRAVAALMPALAVAALAAGQAQARDAAPSPPTPFGVNGFQLFYPGTHDLPTEAHVAAIGRTAMRAVRSVVWWNLVEPKGPDANGEHHFDWAATDETVASLARKELRLDPVLGFLGAWSAGRSDTGLLAPSPAAFTPYAVAVASRYGRKGAFWAKHPDLPYMPVTNYEVWNEENLSANWSPQPEPDKYADLYLAARAALLHVDPHARVAIGALTATTSNSNDAVGFLDRMFQARPKLRDNVDAVGLTIYAQTPAGVMRQVADVRAELDRLGERSTPIDIDETGWSTSGYVALTPISPVGEAQRASLLTQLVDLVARSDCGLGAVFPFAWVSAEDNPADASAWFGITDRKTAAPKPSGAALATAVAAAVAQRPGVSPGGPCGRPDLPALLAPAPREPAPLALTLMRRCRARMLDVGFTLGPEPEPFQRFEINFPDGSAHTVNDPDQGGPRTAPTSLKLALPRKPGRVSLVAFDELGRPRAGATANLRRCPRAAHPRRRHSKPRRHSKSH